MVRGNGMKGLGRRGKKSGAEGCGAKRSGCGGSVWGEEG